MRKTLSALRVMLPAACLLSLLVLPALGQGRERETERWGGQEQTMEQPNTAVEHPNGIVQDWSHRHVVYPRFGPLQTLIALQQDPRALLSWQAAARREWRRERMPRHFRDRDHDEQIDRGLKRDWSISLGSGTTAPAMYPAKFTFYTNATPNCASDFIVFTVNAIGSASQPNILGFNNLYSGTVGSTGICNAPANGRTAGANDDGVSATTIWSYNVSSHPGSGMVATSPALSLDGTKVAFVETDPTFTPPEAFFHVLAPKNGDGVAPNLQTVTSPVSITFPGFVTQAPVAGSGTATSLILASAPPYSDTLSSPFIDYVNDMAYIGNDTGVLFRIKDVFCTTPACTLGGTPAPSFDTNWGTNGALATGCPGKLTGPVVDPVTGNVFVGCSDGKLYGFRTTTGVAITNSPLTVGNGTATGGIVDPPLVDVVNGFLFVVSGSSGVGGPATVVQAKTDFSSKTTETQGAGGSFNLHAPVFNDLYFSSSNPDDWLLYNSGLLADGSASFLWGSAFDASRALTATAPGQVMGSPSELSPLTEFVSGGEDRLFLSALFIETENIRSFNTTNINRNTFPPALESFTEEGSGTTGIVVDNASASAQTDSIYFGVLGSNTAVKLTQSGLQ